jgi:hypothetical protein
MKLCTANIEVPHDILNGVFSLLTSKERWNIRGVSKTFDMIVLATSMMVYPSKHWVNIWPLPESSSNTYSNEVREVFGDYHLTMMVQPNVAYGLKYACEAGDIDVVRLIVAMDINHEEDYKEAYYSACEYGRSNIVSYFDKNELAYPVPNQLGYDSDDELASTLWRRGALRACMGGHIKLAEELLDNLTKALKYKDFLEFLSLTCYRGQFDTVKFLCERWTIPDVDDEDFTAKFIYDLMGDLGRHSTIVMLEFIMGILGADRGDCMAAAARSQRLCVVKHFAKLGPITEEEMWWMLMLVSDIGDVDMITYFIMELDVVDGINVNDGVRAACSQHELIDEYFDSLNLRMGRGRTEPFDLKLMREWGDHVGDLPCKCVECVH